MPPNLKPWLVSEDSLTGRLKAICHQDFNVQLLYQGSGHVYLSERKLLGLKARQSAQIREVLLRDGNKPLVYARSVLPLKSLGRRLKPLQRLAQKPLGEFLFKQRDLRRSTIQIAEISDKSGYFESFSGALTQAYWGRRSVFSLSGRQLLVSEIFLTQTL